MMYHTGVNDKMHCHTGVIHQKHITPVCNRPHFITPARSTIGCCARQLGHTSMMAPGTKSRHEHGVVPVETGLITPGREPLSEHSRADVGTRRLQRGHTATCPRGQTEEKSSGSGRRTRPGLQAEGEGEGSESEQASTGEVRAGTGSRGEGEDRKRSFL